jgi:hypothetical protein
MVNGKIVLENGQFKTIDDHELQRDLADVMAIVDSDYRQFVDRHSPAVTPYCKRPLAAQFRNPWM